jgi:hypothetical protein
MKHLLNDLSNEEKNNIREQHATREQHTDGLTVMSETFRRLSNSKLGDSKPLINEQTNTSPVNPQLGIQSTAGTPITLPYLYFNYRNQSNTYLSLSPSDNVKSNWIYTLTSQPKTKTVDIIVTNDKEPTVRVAATYSCASNTMGTKNVYSNVTSMTASINSPTMSIPAKNTAQNPKTIDNYLSNLLSQSGSLMNFGIKSDNPDVTKIGGELKRYCGK